MHVGLKAGILAGALAIVLGAMPGGAQTASAQTDATAPASCNWVGTSTGTPTGLSDGQVILRLKVNQDLGNPDATHGAEDTVQLNYAYDSSYMRNFEIRSGTPLHISGFIRQGGQCVVDTLNVGTLEPGHEGYILPTGICLTAGSGTISVAEKASSPLGCAVGPAVKLTTPTQPFQNGRMFYSRGIYVLTNGEAGLPSGGSWSGNRDPFRDPEPETLGLTPPAQGLVEPKRGFGKTWRELDGGPDGTLGWAVEDEHSEGGSWQQFEHGIVIVLDSGLGYVLYYDNSTWEQRNR
jgi:hypothetical protein